MEKSEIKKEYKIVFDSNIIFCDEEKQLNKVFNSRIKEVSDLLKNDTSDRVTLCLPQLAIDERISQRLLQIEDQYSKFNSSLDNLNVFDKIGVKKKEFKIEKYKKKLNFIALGDIKKFRVEIIPTIKIDQDLIIKRALQKTSPFNAKGESDKGFKDTLIWLSLLADAKNNDGCKYVLLTNDKSGFKQEICEKEFKEYSSESFFVKNNLDDLKIFLDEELNLDLKLKEVFSEVKQKVLSRFGTITVETEHYLSEKYGKEYCHSNFFGAGALGYSSYGECGKNFDYYSLDINNIYRDEKDPDKFIVSAILCVQAKEGSEEVGSIYVVPHAVIRKYGSSNENLVKYIINFEYNRKLESIKMLAVSRDVYHCPSYGSI